MNTFLLIGIPDVAAILIVTIIILIAVKKIRKALK